MLFHLSVLKQLEGGETPEQSLYKVQCSYLYNYKAEAPKVSEAVVNYH